VLKEAALIEAEADSLAALLVDWLALNEAALAETDAD
jgi:hypothetical protein